MKKILLLILTVMSIAACKEKADDNLPNHGETTSGSNIEDIDDDTDDDDKKLRGNCATTFVLDKTQSLPSDWETENEGNICEIRTDMIFVDIMSLSSSRKAIWLQKYKGNINYAESARHIEGVHKNYILPDSSFKDTPLTVTAINSLLATSTLSTDNYDKYIVVSVDSNGDIDFATDTEFRPASDKAYFSVPLFRSIIQVNSGRINSNPTFLFSQGVPGDPDKIFFRVEKNDGNYLYYNYSDDPGFVSNINSPI